MVWSVCMNDYFAEYLADQQFTPPVVGWTYYIIYDKEINIIYLLSRFLSGELTFSRELQSIDSKSVTPRILAVIVFLDY